MNAGHNDVISPYNRVPFKEKMLSWHWHLYFIQIEVYNPLCSIDSNHSLDIRDPHSICSACRRSGCDYEHISCAECSDIHPMQRLRLRTRHLEMMHCDALEQSRLPSCFDQDETLPPLSTQPNDEHSLNSESVSQLHLFYRTSTCKNTDIVMLLSSHIE